MILRMNTAAEYCFCVETVINKMCESYESGCCNRSWPLDVTAWVCLWGFDFHLVQSGKSLKSFICPSLIYIFLLHYLELISFKHNLSISGHHLSNTHLNRKKNDRKQKKTLVEIIECNLERRLLLLLNDKPKTVTVKMKWHDLLE